MGFKSTFISEDVHVEWPEWFREKYTNAIWFNVNNRGVIASKHEAKTYSGLSDLETDIQRAIDWDSFTPGFAFVLVYLHECGGVTRCEVTKASIAWTEPIHWRLSNGVQHWYCAGCSDAAHAAPFQSEKE